MNRIRDPLGAMLRSDITSEQAVAQLAELPSEALADFIVDAFNRAWFSHFNLGLDDNGHPI